jgi:hypothetical protein
MFEVTLIYATAQTFKMLNPCDDSCAGDFGGAGAERYRNGEDGTTNSAAVSGSAGSAPFDWLCLSPRQCPALPFLRCLPT